MKCTSSCFRLILENRRHDPFEKISEVMVRLAKEGKIMPVKMNGSLVYVINDVKHQPSDNVFRKEVKNES